MWILDTTPFFLSLSGEDRIQLSYFCQEKKINKWEELFRQWDEASAFYIVISGSFGVYKKENGVVTELGPVCVGDILWEMALFWESGVRNATIIAKEDSTLVTILDFSIKELTRKYPDILKKIQDIIKERS